MLCVFMVEGMSIVVNVVLSLMSVMSPPPPPPTRIVQHIGAHGGEVMYFGCFCFRGELVSLIVMISACVS